MLDIPKNTAYTINPRLKWKYMPLGKISSIFFVKLHKNSH